MIESSGKYFDGQSSASKPVRLSLDDTKGILKVTEDDGYSYEVELIQLKIDLLSKQMIIRDSPQSVAYIRIDDRALIQTIREFQKNAPERSIYQRLISLGMGAHLLLALTILGTIIGGYFVVLPWVAEKTVAVLPESYDNKIGSSFFEEYIRYEKVDSTRTEWLNQFAALLDLGNSKPLSFSVMESSVVNAFALPDGNIVVYTGLLDKMKDHSELVGLLGHEAAHVNNRHSMKMLCRDLAGYIFISAVLGDINGVMAIIAEKAHALNSLSYSRKFETEADSEGLDILIKNRVDPNGLTNLFSHLRSDTEEFIPEFTSSHPLTQSRIDVLCEKINDLKLDTEHNSKLDSIFTLLIK